MCGDESVYADLHDTLVIHDQIEEKPTDHELAETLTPSVRVRTRECTGKQTAIRGVETTRKLTGIEGAERSEIQSRA